jgi:ABC-type polysaccharide/polyol phosphate export permease
VRATHRRSLEVIGHLTAREFRIRYANTTFGWLWAVLPPFARLTVLGLVFTQVLPVGEDDYLALLAVGLLGWTWFSAAVSDATRSAVDRRELLAQPELPRYVAPVVSVLNDTSDYVAALPVLLAIVALSSGGLPVTVLLLPFLMVPVLVLGLGLGMLAASFDVRFRDTSPSPASPSGSATCCR